MFRMLNPPLRRPREDRIAGPAQASLVRWPTSWLSCLAAIAALCLLLPFPAVASERESSAQLSQLPRPEGRTTDQFIEATLDWISLPRSVDTLALTRVTLAPGAKAAALNGAHLVYVESGALTLQEFARAYPPPTGTPEPVHEDVPAGPPITYRAGEQLIAYYDAATPPAISNVGTELAIALVVSIAATGGADLAESFTGWAKIEPLAEEDASRVGSPLAPPGGLGAQPLTVSLARVHYAEDTSDESMSLPFEDFDRGAHLLVVESGALNVRLGDQALYWSPGDGPKALPGNSRISLVPGDQLMVVAPGRIGTRNVARGESSILIVTVGEDTNPAG